MNQRRRAPFAAFAPDGNDALPRARIGLGDAVGHVSLAYLQRDGKRKRARLALERVNLADASVGLSRGLVLINQSTTLKEATRLHHEKNDQEGAYQLVHAMASLHRQTLDPTLAEEKDTVEKLESTLAKLSGHSGESAPEGLGIDPVSGLPHRPSFTNNPRGGLRR